MALGDATRGPSGALSFRQDVLVRMTSRAGVFATGDVRAGSLKRRRGSTAVQLVHQYLARK